MLVSKEKELMSIESLVARGLLNREGADQLSGRQRARLDAILLAGGPQPRETEVTRFLNLADGVFAQALIAIFCQTGLVTPEPGMQIMSGTDFKRGAVGARIDRRSLDIIVFKWIGESDILDGSTKMRRQAVVAIEAKFTANVNARDGYCPDSPDSYSNQIICYVHGCMHPPFDSGVKFVWLGLPLNTGGPLWGRKGINQSTLVNWPELASVLAEQEEAEKQWKMLEWPELYRSLDRSFTSEIVEPEIREAILRGLRCTTIERSTAE
jgi:hypothetical protein